MKVADAEAMKKRTEQYPCTADGRTNPQVNGDEWMHVQYLAVWET